MCLEFLPCFGLSRLLGVRLEYLSGFWVYRVLDILDRLGGFGEGTEIRIGVNCLDKGAVYTHKCITSCLVNIALEDGALMGLGVNYEA